MQIGQGIFDMSGEHFLMENFMMVIDVCPRHRRI
jgi:hypothetical protein